MWAGIEPTFPGYGPDRLNQLSYHTAVHLSLMGFEPNVGALKKHSPIPTRRKGPLKHTLYIGITVSILGLEPKTICLKGNCSTH